ncbi:MAG: hypothetical protein ACI4TD_03560 [Phocaeicola sp.]
MDLTASVYNLNPCATKQDVAASVRLLLADSMDNYKVFEEYMLTQIPKLDKTDMYDHFSRLPIKVVMNLMMKKR